MSRCLETCFYCGRFLSPRHEHDHFPIPRRAGGYRGRFAGDPLPARLRALPDWSTDELVESVLAATTTEARLYLADSFSVSWDWRDVEMDVQPGDPRSGSDASR